MRQLADAGQKVITATLNKDPWNNQCYDAYADMIVWTRLADGTWEYDFTVFDRWVRFMLDLGVGKYVNCYSMLPWNNMLHYKDAVTGEFVDVKADPGTPAFREMWGPFLPAFVGHLREKGWLGITNIAMDERSPEVMAAATALLKEVAPELGIALADNHKIFKQYPYIKDMCASIFGPIEQTDIVLHLVGAGRGDLFELVRRRRGLRRIPALGLQLVGRGPDPRLAVPEMGRRRHLPRLSRRPLVDPFRTPRRRHPGLGENPVAENGIQRRRCETANPPRPAGAVPFVGRLRRLGADPAQCPRDAEYALIRRTVRNTA